MCLYLCPKLLFFDQRMCFSSGGADWQQCVWLHPPGGPRWDGRAAGNQAASEGRGRLPHRPWERLQLRIHLLPGWYPWTWYCLCCPFIKTDRNIRKMLHSLTSICIIKTTKTKWKWLHYSQVVLPLLLPSSTAPSSPHSPADDPPDRGFFIRMKSTLTKRGLHVKSSGYKVEIIRK